MRLIIGNSVGVGISRMNMFNVIDERNAKAVNAMLDGYVETVCGWRMVKGLDIKHGHISGYVLSCVRSYVKSVGNMSWPMFISMKRDDVVYSGHVIDVLMNAYGDCGYNGLFSKAHKAMARSGHIHGWRLCSEIVEHADITFIHPLLTLSYGVANMKSYSLWLNDR